MENKKTGSDADTDSTKSNPIKKEEEIQQSNDEHIDQDFPGFPHHPSTKEEIKKKKGTTAEK